MESLSEESLALVNSIRDEGENVSLIRNVHTVVDTGELQLVRASCNSAEVQTDFEPMWCFQNMPHALENRAEETAVTVGPAVPLGQGSTMIDLQGCDKFSIVHLEDMRDPSSQFVMVQTDAAANKVTSAVGSNYHLHDANTLAESESQSHVPVEIINAPAMFVGGNGRHWKREIELSPDKEVLHQGLDVDSGIWDMMQALSSSTDVSARSDVFHASMEQETVCEACVNDASSSALSIPPSLHGVYKMFQIADGSNEREIDVRNEEVSKISSYSRARNGNHHSSSVGGLEDILEPAALVDFVVHRVEAETVRLERVDALDGKTARDQSQQQNTNGRSVRITDRAVSQRKVVVDSATGTDDQDPNISDKSYKGDLSVHRLSDSNTLNINSEQTVVETYDSATNTPRVKKKHKDVVRVTSARFGRSLKRRVNSGRGRGSWKDANSYARKSVSADISRSSSLLDVENGHQEMARSSEVFSDPSPEPGEHQDVQPASQSVRVSRQPYTSSPCGWRNSGAARSSGLESHEWFTDGSSSTASGPMTSSLDLFMEPDLVNFERFPDWMKELPDSLLHVPLSDICIPGSHIAVAIERDLRTDLDFSKCNYEMADFLRKLPDLALFNNFRALMKTIWKAWMPKQCLSIYDQLIAGSRYLDMRVTKLSGHLHGEHGLYSRPVKAYLRDVRRFVEEHTSEVVILHFQSSEYLDRADKRQLVTALFQAFGARMACTSMVQQTSSLVLPSLNQLRFNEKQVMIFFPSSDMELIRNHIFGGLVWSDELIRVVASPKTQTVAELSTALNAAVASSGAPASLRNQLEVVKAVLSPDMSMVFGRYEFRSMRELVTYEAAPAITRWVTEKASLNVVAVDFVGIGSTVHQLLQLNTNRA